MLSNQSASGTEIFLMGKHTKSNNQRNDNTDNQRNNNTDNQRNDNTDNQRNYNDNNGSTGFGVGTSEKSSTLTPSSIEINSRQATINIGNINVDNVS